jgi:hypothetical protein
MALGQRANPHRFDTRLTRRCVGVYSAPDKHRLQVAPLPIQSARWDRIRPCLPALYRRIASSARMESTMTNPYAAPRQAEVEHDFLVGRQSLLALLAASTIDAFIALACGMTTCWLRSGWLKQQLLLPVGDWQLPTHFWFHCGVWFVSALGLSILALPMYLYLRRSLKELRLIQLVFAISSIATIGFEAFKNYQMIEPPTHVVIVLVSLLVLHSLPAPSSIAKRRPRWRKQGSLPANVTPSILRQSKSRFLWGTNAANTCRSCATSTSLPSRPTPLASVPTSDRHRTAFRIPSSGSTTSITLRPITKTSPSK